MGLTFDYTCLLRGGPQGELGVDPAVLERAEGQHAARLAAVRDRGFVRLPDDTAMLAECRAFADARRGQFENLVVLGIGGSALGTQALHAALSPPLNNILPNHSRPRLFVVDNVDPVLVGGILCAVNPATTLFNVISKSGSTAETMSQFLLFLENLKTVLGNAWREHIVVTTDASKGFLRRFAEDEDIPAFTIPDDVGGRFSVLTPVGMLPGAVLGWDLDGLMAGAAAGRKASLSADFDRNPAALFATVHHALDTLCKLPVQVQFPYSHQLRLLVDWYVQLCAESLGKLDAEGRPVGPTPHKAVGATDQHSQVQLFAQGPADKSFTFLRVLHHADDIVIPNPPKQLAELSYLSGKTFGQLLDAECRATFLALVEAGRPCGMITFPAVSAGSVGEYLMMMELAVAYAGELYGIDAFDQPGVEAGKLATYGLMGRAGFEAEGQRVRSRKLSDPDRVV